MSARIFLTYTFDAVVELSICGCVVKSVSGMCVARMNCLRRLVVKYSMRSLTWVKSHHNTG